MSQKSLSRKSATIWLIGALIAILALAGCAPRPGAGTSAAAAGDSGLAIDLPALSIDFDDNGQASMGGVPLAQLAGSFGVAGLDQLVVPPNIVAQLKAANIQHIQINTTPEGLLLMVNGQVVPSIGWDGETLSSTGEALKLLGYDLPAVEKLLPQLSHLGVAVTARFPVAEGKDVIPVVVEGGDAGAKAKAIQDEFLKQVGVPPTINLPMLLNADGSWTMAGMTPAEWTTLTGDPFWEKLIFDPGKIQNGLKMGLKEIALEVDANGLHAAVNGKGLPYLSWSGGKLNNLINVAASTGLVTQETIGMDPTQLTEMIDQFLPILTAGKTSLRVIFPK